MPGRSRCEGDTRVLRASEMEAWHRDGERVLSTQAVSPPAPVVEGVCLGDHREKLVREVEFDWAVADQEAATVLSTQEYLMAPNPWNRPADTHTEMS